MKKISIILIALAAVLTVSCKDFLTETDPNKITSGNYYKNEADLTNVLNQAYASLKGNYYFVNSYHFTDIHSNLTICEDSGARGGAYYQWYAFTLTEQNEFLLSRYQRIYASIGYADKLIYHLNDISWSDPNTRNSYEAQARFIRALGFYTLVTEWGPVPVFDGALTSMGEIQAANHRAPKADVYAQIYKDLDKVVGTDADPSVLLDRDSAADCGRVSKAAGYALYGKALLQQATDEDFSAQKAELLTKAISMLNKAWALRGWATDNLPVAFADIWDLAKQKGCLENIFQINFIQKNATLGSDFAYVYGPAAETGITSMHSCNGSSQTNQAFYDKYAAGDARKAFLRKTVYAQKEYYHSMKYVDKACGSDGFGGNNWIVLRYADVALMLAEAYYWSSDEPNARIWLNKVRARAGVAGATAADTGTVLRDAIYEERMKEFIHEGHSWHDYLRGYSKAELKAHFQPLQANFTDKDYLFPIPYSERVLNPEGLYQNPGYLNE